jgi:hypothetical protein
MSDIDVAAADHLLTTTKQVRQRLDLTRPVPRELLLECVEHRVGHALLAQPSEPLSDQNCRQ